MHPIAKLNTELMSKLASSSAKSDRSLGHWIPTSCCPYPCPYQPPLLSPHTSVHWTSKGTSSMGDTEFLGLKKKSQRPLSFLVAAICHTDDLECMQVSRAAAALCSSIRCPTFLLPRRNNVDPNSV